MLAGAVASSAFLPLPTARRASSHGRSARMMAAWPPPDAAPEYEWDATTSSGPLGRGADALFEDLFRRALETEASQDFRSYDDGRSRLRGDVGGYSGVVGVVRELVAARGALAALASQRVLRRLFPDWPPRFGAVLAQRAHAVEGARSARRV